MCFPNFLLPCLILDILFVEDCQDTTKEDGRQMFYKAINSPRDDTVTSKTSTGLIPEMLYKTDDSPQDATDTCNTMTWTLKYCTDSETFN